MFEAWFLKRTARASNLVVVISKNLHEPEP